MVCNRKHRPKSHLPLVISCDWQKLMWHVLLAASLHSVELLDAVPILLERNDVFVCESLRECVCVMFWNLEIIDKEPQCRNPFLNCC